MSFKSLGLSAELLRAIDEQGYSQATPIQTQAIPVVLQGKDLLAGAQTGTGKTAGFTLPMLQLLNTTKHPGNKNQRTPGTPRALVLTPTRELAAQVGDSVKNYSRHLPVKSAVVFGGVSINPQITKLRSGIDILVATPGRLLDHISQNTVKLSSVEILVLDEADRMLDMGFIRDIKKLLAQLPKQKQTLLFSATFSPEIKQLANGLLKAPVLIEVARQNTTAERINQKVHPVDRKNKPALLSYIIGSKNMHQVLVFTRTKHGANRLVTHLDKDGISAVAIHGNKSQGARTKALADFKAGKVRVLVATDIAARGLDIQQLPHVINFELPNVAEDYVHRIGRTGRAGHKGEAHSLVCVDEHKLLKDIERLLKRELRKDIVPGYEPDPSIKAEPIRKARNNNPANAKPSRRKQVTQEKGQGKAYGKAHGKAHGKAQGKPHGKPKGKAKQAPLHSKGNRNRRSSGGANPL